MASKCSPDLIILDINLADMNGIEVLAKIRNDRATKNTPVFAMSAAATKNDIARGLDAGFEQHLTKPLKIPLVFSAISEIFGTDKN